MKSPKIIPETKPAEKPAVLVMPTRETNFTKPLSSALKIAAPKITDKQVEKIALLVKQKQADYVAAAIKLGIMLLCKKEFLGHGKFNKWLEGLAGQKGNGVSSFEVLDHHPFGGVRALRLYMYLARRYLSAFDLRDKLDGRHSLAHVIEEMPSLAAGVSNLPALAISDKFLDDGDIQKFVNGRSLRRILSDLREAEKDAADDEAEGSKTIDADTHKPVEEEETPDEEAKPQSGEQLELLLWKNWKEEAIPAIEGVFKTATTAASRMSSDLQKGYWLGVAKDLRAKADSAERFAKAAAIAAEKEADKKSKAQDSAAATIA